MLLPLSNDREGGINGGIMEGNDVKHILISYNILRLIELERRVNYSVGGSAGVARAPVGVAGGRGRGASVGLTGQGDRTHRGIHWLTAEITVITIVHHGLPTVA